MMVARKALIAHTDTDGMVGSGITRAGPQTSRCKNPLQEHRWRGKHVKDRRTSVSANIRLMLLIIVHVDERSTNPILSTASSIIAETL